MGEKSRGHASGEAADQLQPGYLPGQATSSPVRQGSCPGCTYRPLQRQRGAGSHWAEPISNRPDNSNHFGWLVVLLF